MTFSCRKASVRASAAQWSVDFLADIPGGDLVPCSFAVLPTGCTFLVPSSRAGERLIAEAASELGRPSSTPQTVKGGSCGGEEEDGEFPFAGAMLSVTWEFPKESREEFIRNVVRLIGPCEGLTG
jgi:hypothetical protein